MDADQISPDEGDEPAEGPRATIEAIRRCLEYLRDSAQEHRQMNLAYLIDLAALEARRVGAHVAEGKKSVRG